MKKTKDYLLELGPVVSALFEEEYRESMSRYETDSPLADILKELAKGLPKGLPEELIQAFGHSDLLSGEKQKSTFEEYLDREFEDLGSCIRAAFIHAFTKQGDLYWNFISNAGKPNPVEVLIQVADISIKRLEESPLFKGAHLETKIKVATGAALNQLTGMDDFHDVIPEIVPGVYKYVKYLYTTNTKTVYPDNIQRKNLFD